MKELNDILKAYDKASSAGQQMALATVVKVEGSSYRRPGARMLVTDDGQLTGAISGGCLEGDAKRKALMAIASGENKLVTYDTTDEDDAKFGVQLGCNGIVHILFEPLGDSKKRTPIKLLKQVADSGKVSVIATLFSFGSPLQLGTSLLLRDGRLSSIIDSEKADIISPHMDVAFQNGQSFFVAVDINKEQQEAFIEYVLPNICVVIAGAGNDVMPLSEMTAVLGWDTIIADGRPAQVTATRFPKAHKLIRANAEELLDEIRVDERTVFLLMTHNYNYDLELLSRLPATPTRYIGVLGPKKKLDRMLAELSDRGQHFSEEELSKIYGPVGLDLGAETAEEIALSIVSEIQSVFANRTGAPLRQKTAPIHANE